MPSETKPTTRWTPAFMNQMLTKAAVVLSQSLQSKPRRKCCSSCAKGDHKSSLQAPGTGYKATVVTDQTFRKSFQEIRGHLARQQNNVEEMERPPPGRRAGTVLNQYCVPGVQGVSCQILFLVLAARVLENLTCEDKVHPGRDRAEAGHSYLQFFGPHKMKHVLISVVKISGWQCRQHYSLKTSVKRNDAEGVSVGK